MTLWGICQLRLQRLSRYKIVRDIGSDQERGRQQLMQDRHIGDVRVTRIEEQMGPGFPAKDFFPEFEADTFAAEGHWLAPSYYQPESGRLMTSIHSWLLRTGKYTILVDACSGNHKPRPGM